MITGAGGSFGREGCLYFARRGARVAAMDMNETTLDETLQAVRADVGSGVFIEAFDCDVTDVSSVEGAVSSVVEKLGGIDMLWNNAGYQGQIKPTLEYDPADFAAVMNINVTGMFIVLQSVAKQMAKTSGKYSIVNTASVAGLRGTPGESASIIFTSCPLTIIPEN